MYLISCQENCFFVFCFIFDCFPITPFVNKPDSARDLTISVISSISSFEIINVAVSEKVSFE